ncbi:lyase family protein [uncultured Jatrophihabitans sp.]|uniref:lyase family protein n=1 Tax=uncultured Jatrophihabitans sp. TaxID=1610747 RepID=UPI0035C9F732
MSALLWPGDNRAGEIFADGAVLDAMVATEAAWLSALVDAGIAPRSATTESLAVVGPDDAARVAAEAEAGGTPVAPVLALLRARLGGHEAATWLHRGLTSQDVLDTALMICARDAVAQLRPALQTQTAALAELADAHRNTPMIARTLTQHAVPTTFGVKVATWLHGLLDAVADLDALRFPVQLGGAAGTRAALFELATLAGCADPADTVDAVVTRTAQALDLDPAAPWHTTRAPVTRIGDALVRCTDAWGHIANDVLVLGRPELGELTEPSGGGSSTMPQKANPVLAVLLRRAALTAPGVGMQLHVASASAVDERPDGGWHAEWQPLQLLARHAVSAAAQATELITSLRVHPDRMQANLAASLPGALAERDSMRALFGADATAGDDAYLCTGAGLVDAAITRAAGKAR